MKLWRSKKGIPQWTFTQPQINQTSVLLNQDWTLRWTATWTAGKTRLFQAFWQLVGGCLPLEASTTGVLTLLENEVAAFRSCLRALVGSISLSHTVSGMPPETIWIHQLWRKHLRDVSASVRQSTKHQQPSVLQFVDPIHLHDNEDPYSSSRIVPEKHSNILILTVTVSIDYVVQPDTVTPPSFTDPKHCNCIFYVHIFTSYYISATQPHPLVTSIPSQPVAPVPPA